MKINFSCQKSKTKFEKTLKSESKNQKSEGKIIENAKIESLFIVFLSSLIFKLNISENFSFCENKTKNRKILHPCHTHAYCKNIFPLKNLIFRLSAAT